MKDGKLRKHKRKKERNVLELYRNVSEEEEQINKETLAQMTTIKSL